MARIGYGTTTRRPDSPNLQVSLNGRLKPSVGAWLLKRDETETPHEHVAGNVGGGQTAPAPAIRSPVINHGVRWGLRNYAGVRGHQHAVYVELD